MFVASYGRFYYLPFVIRFRLKPPNCESKGAFIFYAESKSRRRARTPRVKIKNYDACCFCAKQPSY